MSLCFQWATTTINALNRYDLRLKTENCNPISLFLQTFKLTARPVEPAAHMRLLTTDEFYFVRSGGHCDISNRQSFRCCLPVFGEPQRVYLCGISRGMPQECVSEASLAAALLFMSVKKVGHCCLLAKHRSLHQRGRVLCCRRHCRGINLTRAQQRFDAGAHQA